MSARTDSWQGTVLELLPAVPVSKSSISVREKVRVVPGRTVEKQGLLT